MSLRPVPEPVCSARPARASRSCDATGPRRTSSRRSAFGGRRRRDLPHLPAVQPHDVANRRRRSRRKARWRVAVASGSWADSVRIWPITSRWRGPRTGRSPPDIEAVSRGAGAGGQKPMAGRPQQRPRAAHRNSPCAARGVSSWGGQIWCQVGAERGPVHCTPSRTCRHPRGPSVCWSGCP